MRCSNIIHSTDINNNNGNNNINQLQTYNRLLTLTLKIWPYYNLRCLGFLPSSQTNRLWERKSCNNKQTTHWAYRLGSTLHHKADIYTHTLLPFPPPHSALPSTTTIPILHLLRLLTTHFDANTIIPPISPINKGLYQPTPTLRGYRGAYAAIFYRNTWRWNVNNSPNNFPRPRISSASPQHREDHVTTAGTPQAPPEGLKQNYDCEYYFIINYCVKWKAMMEKCKKYLLATIIFTAVE